MPDWATQALVGGVVGLITALVASWFNKIAYRDQIAESELTSGLFADAKAVWGAVVETRVQTEQLLAHLDYVMKQNRESEQGDLFAQLNEFYEPESRQILTAVGQLGRYYVSLPSPAVDALREYEEIVFSILKLKQFDRASELVRVSEQVFWELRVPVANVVRRRRKVADILSEPVSGGVVPTYVRTALGCGGSAATQSEVPKKPPSL
jgi:hypothetical protein